MQRHAIGLTLLLAVGRVAAGYFFLFADCLANTACCFA